MRRTDGDGMFFYSMKHKSICMATVALLLLLLASPLLAQEKRSKYTLFQEPNVELGRWTHELEIGPGMNATGECLKGSKFVGQNLQGAIFDDCDLFGVWFDECDLSEASFCRACLTGVYIAASGLKEADFSDAILNGGNLVSATLTEEQLKSTHSYKTKNLSKCTISACGIYLTASDKSPVKYNFQKANLSGALLTGGDFSNCDFTDANISNIRFSNSRITATQLASTSNYKRRKLHHMRFSNFLTATCGPCAIDGKIDFSGIDLTGTNFRGSPLDANFEGAIITECSFCFTITKEQLCVTQNYRDGNLVNIKLFGIDLSGCDLSRQNISKCTFSQCDFSNAIFEDSVITGADFGKKTVSKCTGLTVGQIKSTWNYKHGRMEGVVLPDEIAEALKKESLPEDKN